MSKSRRSFRKRHCHSVIHVSIRSKTNTHANGSHSLSQKDQQRTAIQADSWSSNRWEPVNKFHRRQTRNRLIYSRTCCCCDWRICMLVGIYAAILIGTAIAAISLALINKPPVTNTTSTTATMTTTTKGLTLLTSTNETLYPIWNTFVGGNSTPSMAGSDLGNYFPAQPPSLAFDRNPSTKYTNFGPCNESSAGAVACGLNTGVYLTPSHGPSCLQTLQFCTANSIINRDPMTVTIEGSNQPSSLLTDGSSWTLIYNGSSGLDTTTGRLTYGVTQNISNAVWYLSYRILITSKRGLSNAVQYSEIELIGY